MIPKSKEKLRAVKLRKQGKTYSEILKEVPVAKSTLSAWFRDVKLSQFQNQRITAKKRAAQRRGGEARHRRRVEGTKKIYKESKRQIGKLSEREKWLIGVTLYWTEGAKEKPWRVGSMFQFINSDPHMITFLLHWLNHTLKIPKSEISFRIHVHENHEYRIDEIIKYWTSIIRFSKPVFQKPVFKRHTFKSNRRNVNANYQGLLEVRAYKSSRLVRRIEGWTMGIVDGIS